MAEQISYVVTNESDCAGCNKCIFKCPTGANEAFFEADDGKVFIKHGFCISCGECIEICDHGARGYFDDMDRFFKDLEAGEQISVVIAPSAKFHFKDIGNLIGYLKSIGVNKIYDVSLGADICVWGHLRAIEKKNLTSIIAQPCPVVVSYIEKYKAELISKLSPVHSPVACLGIYLKKYLGVTDKIMFLSPCIGKKRECSSTQTKKVLEYNVTFKKLADYINKKNIDLTSYNSSTFDSMEGSIGFTFPRPGGLSENIKYHLGEDVWIKHIEGIHNIDNYFNEYIEDLAEGKAVPLIIDALNCQQGCNFGTGANKDVRQNEIDYQLNKAKSKITKENTHKLMKHFDDSFDLNDFLRGYTDRSVDYKKDETVDLEQAFLSLGKITYEDRNVNCFSCGYGNCNDFAYDLAIGSNDKNNCKHYLLNKFKKLSLYDDLTTLNNRYSFNLALKRLSKNHTGFVGIVYIDINGLKEANDTYGHSYGDTLIISCANILSKVFYEKVYRVGGDEFVVLQDNTNSEEFTKMLNILDIMFKSEDKLIVSVGSAISYSSMDLEHKMNIADQEMYRAKEEYYKSVGRNRRSY